MTRESARRNVAIREGLPNIEHAKAPASKSTGQIGRPSQEFNPIAHNVRLGPDTTIVGVEPPSRSGDIVAMGAG